MWGGAVRPVPVQGTDNRSFDCVSVRSIIDSIMNTAPIRVHLRNVKVLGTGMGGGHTYIHGMTEYQSHGTVDAWAYFDFEDPQKENEFEKNYKGGDIEVESASWEFNPSTGLSLHKISWKNLDMDR